MKQLGQLPAPGDNDGITPSLSQVWGDIIHVAAADHLDVIGHFGAPDHDPFHYDWLVSGTRFTRTEFNLLWERIADYVIAS